MTTQPDIIWNEQCLGIRIGEQVCTYLKKHDAEYQRLQEPMFTITATDRHGVIYHGRIRRLTPRECLRLQGYRDGQISKMEKETSDNQLYKQAGNGVTVNVIEAIGRNLKAVDEEIQSGSPVPEAKGG